MLDFFKKHNNPKNFLTSEENEKLMERVQKFEKRTGCELVYHLRRRLGPEPLKANEALFMKFGLNKTQFRNAILVTLAIQERQFAIWADEGVMRRAGDKLWADVSIKMSQSLKNGKNLEALLWAAEMSADILASEQSEASRVPNGNELSDTPLLENEDDEDSQ